MPRHVRPATHYAVLRTLRTCYASDASATATPLQNEGNWDHLLVCDGSTAFSDPQVDTGLSCDGCLIDFGVVDGLAHCAAMKSVNKVEWDLQLSVDEWNGIACATREGVFLCDRESAEMGDPSTVSNHVPELLDAGRINGTSGLSGVKCVEKFCDALDLVEVGCVEDGRVGSKDRGDGNFLDIHGYVDGGKKQVVVRRGRVWKGGGLFKSARNKSLLTRNKDSVAARTVFMLLIPAFVSTSQMVTFALRERGATSSGANLLTASDVSWTGRLQRMQGRVGISLLRGYQCVRSKPEEKTWLDRKKIYRRK